MTETVPRKTCPDCGELVQPEARICRFCRFSFDTGESGALIPAGGGSAPATSLRPPTPLPEALPLPVAPPVQLPSSGPSGDSAGGQNKGTAVAIVIGVVVALAYFGGIFDSGSNSPSVGSPSSPVDIVEDIVSDATPGQDNAKRAAEDYLNTAAFSRSGLIEQLKFEGYSLVDATYGVDAVNPDWNEQAAKAAQDYLNTSAFSRSGLIEQLEFEGYSPAQAEYGVSQTGL